MIYYSDERCALLQGDCLALMAKLPDQCVHAIITDPPYGTTACKWDSVIPFAPMWEQLKRIIKPNGAIVLFGSQPFTSALIMSNPKMFKYCWVWEKPNGTNFISTKYQPFRVHEDIVIFSDGAITYTPNAGALMTYNQQKTAGKPYVAKTGKAERSAVHRPGSDMAGHVSVNEGDRCPRSVIHFNPEKGLHPTQKPVALLEYLIRTYTNEGETVLDFTMGSGTTGVACMKTGRKFIGIERDEKYFEIAKKRIAESNNKLF